MSEKKYNVIYADPPWSYKSTDVPVVERSIGKVEIEYYYDTMSTQQICDIPIKNIAAKNSVCFLWATVPLMPDAFKVLDAWGFKYKTMLTWHKTNSKGMGYWFRGYTEHLLLGVRGDVNSFRCLKHNIFESKVGTHSGKPSYFRQLISEAVEKSFNEPVKLELFARSREGLFPDDEYKGWDVYGNQVNNSIEILTTT
jgi:site-specific DNA-methyltransferase (adenine-specific)